MKGQLKHQKKHGKMEPIAFNLSCSKYGDFTPVIHLSSTFDNDGNLIYQRFEMSIEEAVHLSNQLLQTVNNAANLDSNPAKP